jgi:outer membrane protein TolC
VGVAQRELEMKRAQVAERERRLAADVRLKAGELLAARRNVEVTDERLRINRDGLGLVGDRVREGAAPQLEENLLLVEVNRLDASRQMLESRVTVMTLQLKALAGMEPDAPLRLRAELAGPPPAVTRAEAVAQALAGRPDLEVARADAAKARAKIRKEEAEGRWDASVSVGYQRQDFGFSGLRGVASNGSLQPIQDVFHYFGAGVSITLPVRNRNRATWRRPWRRRRLPSGGSSSSCSSSARRWKLPSHSSTRPGVRSPSTSGACATLPNGTSRSSGARGSWGGAPCWT